MISRAFLTDYISEPAFVDVGLRRHAILGEEVIYFFDVLRKLYFRVRAYSQRMICTRHGKCRTRAQEQKANPQLHKDTKLLVFNLLQFHIKRKDGVLKYVLTPATRAVSE